MSICRVQRFDFEIHENNCWNNTLLTLGTAHQRIIQILHFQLKMLTRQRCLSMSKKVPNRNSSPFIHYLSYIHTCILHTRALNTKPEYSWTNINLNTAQAPPLSTWQRLHSISFHKYSISFRWILQNSSQISHETHVYVAQWSGWVCVCARQWHGPTDALNKAQRCYDKYKFKQFDLPNACN